jgi:pimeloyl-ACP methyl ester carboxylesterase
MRVVPGAVSHLALTGDARQLWVSHSYCWEDGQCSGSSGITVLDLASQSAAEARSSFIAEFPATLRQGDDTARRAMTSTRRSWLAMALAAGLAGQAWIGPLSLSGCGGDSTARAGDFTQRVAIDGGRQFYLECRGTGSPTVVLEAGSGNSGGIWSQVPAGPGEAVLPAVARFTRVCAYDRPGTYLLPDVLSRSDPVAMPRSARDIVLDLHALLRAADVPGPYILVGHSFGGMVARLYATTYPRRIAGLVSIDAQNEHFAAAFKEFLTTEQYLAAKSAPPRCARHRRTHRCSGYRSSSSHIPGPSRTRSASRPTGRSRRWSGRFRIRKTSWQNSCLTPAT